MLELTAESGHKTSNLPFLSIPDMLHTFLDFSIIGHDALITNYFHKNTNFL